MLKNNLTFILLLFVLSFITKANSVSDLIPKLDNTKDPNQILLNINISEKYRDINLDSSKYFIKNAIQIARVINNYELLAKSYKSAGVTYYFLGDYTQALDYYNKSITYFKKLKDLDNVSKIYNNIGIIYESWGDYQSSMSYYLKCLDIEKKLSDTIGIAGSYNNIANTYYYIKKYDKGINYLKKSYKIFKGNDKKQEANILNNIGKFYETDNKIDSAIIYYKKALEIRKTINDKVGIALSYNNIGYTYFLKKDYSTAIHFYLKSLKFAKKIGSKKQIFSTSDNLSKAYFKINNIDSTKYFLKKCLNLTDSTNFIIYKLDYYLLKSQIYKKQNNFKEALNYYYKYSTLKDSLLNRQKIENTELIYQKFKNRENQKKIEIKNLQIAKDKNETKFKDKINLILVISITILLILLVFVFHLFIINKHINNKLKIESNIRKKIQQSLKYTKEKLQNSIKNKDAEIINQFNYINSILTMLPIGVITSDIKGNINFVNKYAALTFGITDTKQAIGINLFSDNRFIKVGLPKYLNKVIETKNTQKIIITDNNSKLKEPIIYNVTVKLIRNNNSEFLLGLIEDITLQKKYEQNLLKLKDAANESNKLKSIFLANLSHEIRTPLNAIIGFAELLESEDISNEQSKKYLSIIQKNSLSLLNLINDIIDISKIEAGELKISKSITNITDLLKQIYLINKEVSLKNNPNVTIKLLIPDEELFILTDENRLKQILINLINNAIKFTKKGEIIIGYTKNANKINFFVKDTGVGIPDKDISTIFNRFFQASNQVEKTNSGSGLGLAITKDLVELLGGTIKCKSQINKGTEFYFDLPNDFTSLDNKSENKNTKIDLTGINILVAEDNDSNFMYINELLTNNKAKVMRAINGFEVVNILKNNTNFDIIFLDIRMPVVDGISALKEIKKLGIKTPVIAQTAYAINNEQEKYIKLGFDDYISKPIIKNQLFDIISKYIKLT